MQLRRPAVHPPARLLIDTPEALEAPDVKRTTVGEKKGSKRDNDDKWN